MTERNATAGIYTRLSKGNGRSVDEQETANRAECEQHGWAVTEVYTDSVSASRLATKGRPGWARLLADLEAGRFGVLVLWESSRGDRVAETWMGLLTLCRDHGVVIHVTNHHRTYDMDNSRDWHSMAADGIDSAYESEKLRDRINRNVAANAAAGRPHGPTGYGFERVYDERTKKLKEQRPHPEQAAVVREIIRRVASAEPVIAIARDLDERGIPVPAARAGGWGRHTIRNIAMNPAFIGKRRWKGEVIKAVWPALVDEATFYAAVRVLTDPARKTTRPGRAKWLLSYIAACATCGASLSVFPRPGGAHTYGCSDKGCAFMRTDWLDAFIEGAIVERLSEPESYRMLTEGGSDAAVLEARAEAGELRGRLDETALASARGEVSVRSLAIVEADLTPKIRAAEKRASLAAVPPVLRNLDPAEDIREQFEGAPMAARRDIVRLLFEKIELGKAAATGRKAGFDPSRVIYEWKASKG